MLFAIPYNYGCLCVRVCLYVRQANAREMDGIKLNWIEWESEWVSECLRVMAFNWYIHFGWTPALANTYAHTFTGSVKNFSYFMWYFTTSDYLLSTFSHIFQKLKDISRTIERSHTHTETHATKSTLYIIYIFILFIYLFCANATQKKRK